MPPVLADAGDAAETVAPHLFPNRQYQAESRLAALFGRAHHAANGWLVDSSGPEHQIWLAYGENRRLPMHGAKVALPDKEK